MANLIVDIGNTMLKCALVEAERVIDRLQLADFEKQPIAQWLQGRSPERAILSSTRGDSSLCVAALREMGIPTLHFTPLVRVPIEHDYLTPETLGRDRLAAAVGAAMLYPHNRVMIVDCGTALTIDFVDRGRYLGGFIAPGLRMRLRALHDYTASLPLVEPQRMEWAIGQSTQSCIAQGVEQGIVLEIEGHAARFREKYGEITLIFTGGDAKHFVKRIKNTIFADCDLVFVGLNRILEYHVRTEK